MRQVAWAGVGTKELLDYLKGNWEPFAVSPDWNTQARQYDPNLMIVWLKKYEPNKVR